MMSPTCGLAVLTSKPWKTPTPVLALSIALLTNFAWAGANLNSALVAPALCTHHETNTADQAIPTPGKVKPRSSQKCLIWDLSGSSPSWIRWNRLCWSLATAARSVQNLDAMASILDSNEVRASRAIPDLAVANATGRRLFGPADQQQRRLAEASRRRRLQARRQGPRFPVNFGPDPAARREPVRCARERRLRQAGAVGRVEEDDVAEPGRAGRMLHPPRTDIPPRRRADSLHVVLERVERRAVLLDEGAVRGPARKRFEAERAGAGEQVGHFQPLEASEPALQHREQALTGAVACRAGGGAGRRLDRPAAPFPGDDPHFSVFLKAPRSSWRTSTPTTAGSAAN